jgi:hypothetical protein
MKQAIYSAGVSLCQFNREDSVCLFSHTELPSAASLCVQFQAGQNVTRTVFAYLSIQDKACLQFKWEMKYNLDQWVFLDLMCSMMQNGILC